MNEAVEIDTSTSETTTAKLPLVVPRGIPQATTIRLAAAAAGRCEMRGCNREVFCDHLTKEEGNFAERAHIYPFSENGPRGGTAERPDHIHSIDNLMLLCFDCHARVDDKRNVEKYPVALLHEYKNEHEARIRDVCSAGPELRTEVVQVRGLIAGQAVDIPVANVRAAVAPRFMSNHSGLVVDLTGFAEESMQSFAQARIAIRKRLKEFFNGAVGAPEAKHYSVFGLAPIPMLITFGRELGDKLSVDLYQRHRDTQEWKWKSTDDGSRLVYRKIRDGSAPDCVAIAVSVSGAIDCTKLPADIDHRYTLYEVHWSDQKPSREKLRTREQLRAFEVVYHELLDRVVREHRGAMQVDLFPAIPAPIAIACGTNLLPKVHPALRVYDNVKGEFRYCITLNSNEDLQ